MAEQLHQQQHHHQQQQLELPPGFRFHPTDEEIITFYLTPKVLDRTFVATAIGEVDLNKCEPWELPGKAKMGEKEWYFYCQKDRKYPTGIRTNRATEAGYWKATGKDKEIFGPPPPVLVGMKKTLVFYKGRAPRGEKTNWVMHEYRIETRKDQVPYATSSAAAAIINAASKDEWVVCRIFHKSSGIKKVVMPSYAMAGMQMSMGDQQQQSFRRLRHCMHAASSHRLRHVVVVLAGATTAAAACTFFLPAQCSRLRRYVDDGRCGATASDERAILWKPQPPPPDDCAAADVVLPPAAADADAHDGPRLHGWGRAGERAVIHGFAGGHRDRPEQQRSEQRRPSRGC